MNAIKYETQIRTTTKLSDKRRRDGESPPLEAVEEPLTLISVISEYYSVRSASPEQISKPSNSGSSHCRENSSASRKSTRTQCAQSASSAPQARTAPACVSHSAAKEDPSSQSSLGCIHYRQRRKDPSREPSPETSSVRTTCITRSSARARNSLRRDSANVHRCMRCPFSHHSLKSYASHIRNHHGSKWRPASHQPALEHCACEQLYVPGQSLTRHRAACHHFHASYRILGPHVECNLVGCQHQPLQVGACTAMGCAGCSGSCYSCLRPTTCCLRWGATTFRRRNPPACSRSRAGLEFTAEDLDISVVEKLRDNQQARFTRCFNLVLNSAKT